MVNKETTDVDVDIEDDVELDTEDTTDETEWTPPTREQYEELLAGKRKADSESAARKRFLRQAGFNPKTGEPLKPVPAPVEEDDDDDDDVEDVAPTAAPTREDKAAQQNKALQRQLERAAAKAEQKTAREERARSAALLVAVPEALSQAEWNGKSLQRIIKLLDLDDVHVDEDGVDGLDEQIESLKEDFPEFFKRQSMKRAAKDVSDAKTVGAGRKNAPKSQDDMTWTERMKQSLYEG